jgi:probable phosphoglycerate mutase
MVQVVLVWPGSTDFDQQGRIQGQLDLPLCECGKQEVARAVSEMSGLKIAAVYASPCSSAQETAEAIARPLELKVKKIDALENVNLGLWQGLLRDDVKLKQPKVYRQWQDHPETVCPPEGESLDAAQQRLQKALQKLLKKHAEETIVVVAPDPLASLIRNHLTGKQLGDLWKPSVNGKRWEVMTVEPQSAAAAILNTSR